MVSDINLLTEVFMKSFLILALLGLPALTTTARADYNFVNCQSIQGTGHKFSLIMTNGDVLQMRFRVNSHRTRAIHPTRSLDQNVEGFTVYTIPGQTLEVENQILQGGNGTARFAGDEFSCM